MNEILIKNEETGELFPDRRSSTMEIQQTLFKISAQMNTIEEKVDLKMNNLEQKMDIKFGALSELLKEKIITVEKKVDEHCSDYTVDATLKEHDDKIRITEQYVDRIHKLEDRMSLAENKIQSLENLPRTVTWEAIKFIGKKIGIILIAIFGIVFVLGLINPSLMSTIVKFLLP